MRKVWARRDDERGAVLIMATVGLVLAVVSAALAVDLGRIAQERRSNQKVADLAALDASRDLANAQAIAEASALRNGFPAGAGYSVVAIEGTKVNGTCVSAAGSGKVCVTVTSPVKNAFASGGSTIVAHAVAGAIPVGGFMIGSSLATFDASRSAILDRFMGRWLRGTNLTAGLVSWQGLATGNVTLEALRFQLASAGVSAGTVNEMLTTNVTMAQVFKATADALTAQGDVANAAIANTLLLQVTSTTQFQLGEIIG
ncbi:MAG: hypothetical protein ABR540_22230, partial [Acidimicrobiales bacterium]